MDLAASNAPQAAAGRARSARLTTLATVAAPVAVGLAPLVWLWAANRVEFDPSVILRPAIVVVALTLLLVAVFRWVTGDLGAASLLASLTVIAVFAFGTELDVLAAILGREPARGPLLFRVANLVALGLVIVGVTVYARRGGDVGRVARMLGLVAVILTVLGVVRPFGAAADLSLGLDGAGGLAGDGASAGADDGAATTDEASPRPRSVPVLAHDDAAHPDVYYIITDGYERADGLAEYFGFDNTPFIKALEERGFYVPERSLSNYPFTHLSLASSLNERYVPDLINEPRRKSSWLRIQSADVPAAFRDRGYRYVMTRTVYGATSGSPIADEEMGASPTFGNEYESAVVEQSILRGLIPRPSIADYHRAAFEAIETVASDERPTFAFAHIIAPHPPYVFDRDGHVLVDTPILRGQWGGAENNKAYVEQIRYLNTRILEAVDTILARSTTRPIIVIQGDHGSWSTFFHDEGRTHQEIMTERMSILNAYLVPDGVRDLLYPSITPVNTFRAIDKGLFHEPIDLLPDESWYGEGTTGAKLELYTPTD